VPVPIASQRFPGAARSGLQLHYTTKCSEMQFHRIRNHHARRQIRQSGCRTVHNADSKYSKVLTLSAVFPYKNRNQRFTMMSIVMAAGSDWFQEAAEL
jgi:hypothetical protein